MRLRSSGNPVQMKSHPESFLLSAMLDDRSANYHREDHYQHYGGEPHGPLHYPPGNRPVTTEARDSPAAHRRNYFIPPRIDPTIPPTTPASVRCSLPLGRYSISACASLEIGRDCNQTRPGPVSAARKMPSPPKIMFLIPGMRAIWKLTLVWNAPTWPGCTRKVSPARRSLVTTSPESSIQAVPSPSICCNRKPSAAEDARAQRLLKSHPDLNLRRGAKEAEYVYVIGVAEENIPSFQSINKGNDSPEMEEERRNCFVAITRTREQLTPSTASQYRGWPKTPSRFIGEMGLAIDDTTNQAIRVFARVFGFWRACKEVLFPVK
jgi:hypothetical protein